jgi:hypothetical protein
VLAAPRDDEDVAPSQVDGIALPKLDPEGSVPAEEELVLIVLMPRELALDGRDADDRIVHANQILRLERPD